MVVSTPQHRGTELGMRLFSRERLVAIRKPSLVLGKTSQAQLIARVPTLLEVALVLALKLL